MTTPNSTGAETVGDDLGSVGISLPSAKKPSPSLANLIATPSRGSEIFLKRMEVIRLRNQISRLRLEIVIEEREAAVATLQRLPPHQRTVLGAFADNAADDYEGPWAYSFREIMEWTGFSRAQVSRACKALRRYGFLSFERGLFNEDGQVAGSGYAITRAGRSWWTIREDGSQAPLTRDGEVEPQANTTEPKATP